MFTFALIKGHKGQVHFLASIVLLILFFGMPLYGLKTNNPFFT